MGENGNIRHWNRDFGAGWRESKILGGNMGWKNCLKKLLEDFTCFRSK